METAGPEAIGADSAAPLVRSRFRATSITLNLAAAAWGLVNFGLLLWLPADLRAKGYSVSGSNELLFFFFASRFADDDNRRLVLQ